MSSLQPLQFNPQHRARSTAQHSTGRTAQHNTAQGAQQDGGGGQIYIYNIFKRREFIDR